MKVSREQMQQFKAAVSYYQCATEEVEEMKAAYERDPESAAVCFAAIAAHVDLVTAPAADQERVLSGEQFLRLGEISRAMETQADAH